MIVGALSDIGSARENNEDSLFASLDRDMPLYIVADGMGGHNAGEVASKMAVDIVREEFAINNENLNSPRKIRECIKMALEKANEVIYKRSLNELDCEGMGTTVVLGYYFENRFYIGHVGDSRAYVLVDGDLNQITEDHTLVNELIKKGSITESQALSHPQRNAITRALGTSIDIDIDTYEVDFNRADILLLCSDGLYNMVDESIIFKTLKETIDLEEGVASLVQMANENGGKDNITIIAIKFNDEVLE